MTLTQFNRIIEIRTKIISMSSFLCGSVFAATAEGTWSWPLFFLMAAAVLFVDMGTTGFNSYFDFVSGTDKEQYNIVRDKVLVHEGVDPAAALKLSLFLFGTAGILGIIIAFMTSWMVLAVGGISMIAGFTYTGGPFPISRTPAGELFAGGFLGSLLFVLSYYIQAGRWDGETVLASLPFLLLIAMILTVNNTCDMISDRAAGRKTFSILAGYRISRAVIILQWAAALAAALWLILRGTYPFPMVPFFIISLPLAVRELSVMLSRGFSLETKGPSMGSVSRLFLLYSFSMFLGCIITLAV